MMPTLVTGATGLLGNNVVRLLLERGESVRVLTRDNSDPRPLKNLDVEIVHGDVRDAESVRRACAGCQRVVHSAAYVHIGWSAVELARAINVEGTRHVAEAALAAGARMVHVSTVDTLGLGSRDKPADEETSLGEKVPFTYVVTKREAEQLVSQYVQQGLNASIVNPGFMLGPWDWKPSSGRMLLQVGKRFTPFAPTGGMTLCDVRDVAAGILAAFERGEAGRRYILGGHCMLFFDAWKLFAEVAGSRGPKMKAGPLLRWIGGAGGDLWGKLTGREPDLNSAAARASSDFHYYSSARAESELGYHTRPARETVQDAWQWFKHHGYAS
jgi:dihydroflavonol-4-reductase